MAENEKRRSPRKLVVLSAAVTRENAGLFDDDLVAQILDLSRTGALLKIDALLMIGELCTLTLPKPNGGYGDIRVRVVRAERDAENGYRAGVTFRNLDHEQEYLVDLHLMRGTAKT